METLLCLAKPWGNSNFDILLLLVKKQTANDFLSCDTMLGSLPFYQTHMRVPQGIEIHKKGSSRGLPPHPCTEGGSYIPHRNPPDTYEL